MIFHPRPGQNVRVHYAKRYASAMPLHGKTGIVRLVAHGPGPRNVAVEIDGQVIVIPRGNLVAITTETTPAKITGVDEVDA